MASSFIGDWQIGNQTLHSGMRHFVIRWGVTTIAVMAAASVIHGIRYDSCARTDRGGLFAWDIERFLRPILLILSAPLILVTFGFFILVVNGLMLFLVPNIVTGFHVDAFGSAFWGAIIMSVVSWILSAFFRDSDGRVHVLTHHSQIKTVQGRVISPAPGRGAASCRVREAIPRRAERVRVKISGITTLADALAAIIAELMPSVSNCTRVNATSASARRPIGYQPAQEGDEGRSHGDPAGTN